MRSHRPGGAGPGPSIPIPRPADADAPDRFRALAGAWQVLGDPERQAAYDRARKRQLTVQVTVRRPPGPGGTSGMTPLRIPGPPLRAGPVRVEGVRPVRPAGGWDEEDIGLARLALRYLVWDWGWPW
jgi:curved DNA-binding protein CbpA